MSESAILTLAYMLDIAIGDPKRLPHPVRGIGWAITKMENLLRRIIQNTDYRTQNIDNPPNPPLAKLCSSTTRRVEGGEGGFEKLAGIFLVLIIVGSTYGLFFIINLLLTSHFSLLTFIFLVYLVSTTLATHGLIKSAAAIIKTLKNNDTDNAREKLSHIVGRDTLTLDRDSILKATIESLAENASDGIIAPLFYFAIGGLPLAMTYKAINTMDSMIGYRNEKYRNLGWAAARLDDIANYIPARITGLLIALSSAFVFCSLFTVHCSLKIMLRDGRKHPSPNSGVPEAAMAGALGICLGGPSSYGGIAVQKPSIGEERKNTEHRTQNTDILYIEASEQAITITKVVSLLGFTAAAAFLYFRNSL